VVLDMNMAYNLLYENISPDCFGEETFFL